MLEQTEIHTASSFSPQFRNLYYEKYILTYLFNISLTSIIVNCPQGNEPESKPISQLQSELRTDTDAKKKTDFGSNDIQKGKRICY
jgi:hypothetical protein